MQPWDLALVSGLDGPTVRLSVGDLAGTAAGVKVFLAELPSF